MKYDIIDLTLQALECLGIAPKHVEGNFILFDHDHWPCMCVKCSPSTIKVMAFLYTAYDGPSWADDSLFLAVCQAAGRYQKTNEEYLLAADGSLSVCVHLTPFIGYNPLAQMRPCLARFFIHSIPRAKKYIEDLPVLRDALGQQAKWGFANPLERIEEMGCWTDVRQFTEGLVAVADRQGRYGFLDANAELAIPCRWAYAQPFSEGLAAVEDMTGHYGFIDRQGRVAIPCEWSGADWFSEGLAAVKDANGEWGFINTDARLVIPCEWAEVGDFHDGLAHVSDYDGTNCSIDNRGNIVNYGENKRLWLLAV